MRKCHVSFFFFLVFFAQNGSGDYFFVNFTKLGVLFFWFSSVIRCWEQLWLDAPGGLPRLKDKENRAETDVFLLFFRNCIDAPGVPPEAESRRKPCTKRAPNLIVWHRLFRVMFCCFFVDFCGSALKREENPKNMSTLFVALLRFFLSNILSHSNLSA